MYKTGFTSSRSIPPPDVPFRRWDSSETPVGGWSFGVGNITADRNVTINFQSFVLNGLADANYSSISQGDWGAPWIKRAQQSFPSDVKAVHVIFANHLGECRPLWARFRRLRALSACLSHISPFSQMWAMPLTSTTLITR